MTPCEVPWNWGHGTNTQLKQTIQDQISKGNIHVENDEASTSERLGKTTAPG